MSTSRSTARPRVLFLAPVEPWCRENGSSVIIADMLEGLRSADASDLLPIFLRRPPAGCDARVPAGFSGVQLGLEGVPKWISIAKAIALRSSPLRMRFDNGKVARIVAETVRRRGFVPDVVHVEHLPLVDIGLKLAQAYRCPLVYRSHNVEAQLLERRLATRGPLAAAMVRYMARAEADAVKACDATLCISDADLAWVARHAPTARSEVLPCSLLLDRYDAFNHVQRRSEPTIGFAGGLDWAPNDKGLRWFVDNVLPRVRTAIPGVRLDVLARGAHDRPWLTDNAAVRILDHHSDARALFSASWVSIAPLLQGGGVRIKIPESLALGCPVVATSIGAEGHDLPGLHRTDDPSDFASACVAHLASPPAAAERDALRDAVNARHGARNHAAHLVALWRELIAEQPAQR